MWELPALTAGNRTLRLPLSDWAARNISAALLAEAAERRRLLIGEAVFAEPPLLLWVLCQAPAWRQAPPGSGNELIEWFAPTALALLNAGASAGLARVEVAREVRERWAALAVQGLSAAAECVAAKHDESAAVRAQRFRSVIVDPAGWAIDGSVPAELLPTWLSAPGASAAAEAGATGADPAARATGAGTGGCGDTCAVGRRWLDEPVESGDLLGPLVERLVRLERLEHDFAAQLRDAKLAALKELAYGASHEINNPLANIATRAQALLADERDGERRRKLATIAAQAFRAHEMISDLMLFARPPALRRERVDLHGLAARALDEFREPAAARRINLRQTGDAGPVWADVDPTQLAVVLQALLRNAVEACHGPGEVEVEVVGGGLTAAGGGGDARIARLVVRDSGPGLSPRARAHLFDPFFSGREAGRGLGFGLSKAWRIVTDHGGQLRADDAPGGGAMFVVELPRA